MGNYGRPTSTEENLTQIEQRLTRLELRPISSPILAVDSGNGDITIGVAGGWHNYPSGGPWSAFPNDPVDGNSESQFNSTWGTRTAQGVAVYTSGVYQATLSGQFSTSPAAAVVTVSINMFGTVHEAHLATGGTSAFHFSFCTPHAYYGGVSGAVGFTTSTHTGMTLDVEFVLTRWGEPDA